MPDTPGRPPTLVEGPLAHTRGDLTQDNALRPRLSAFLCPGATLAGVALARQADARAVVDPGGDLQAEFAGLAHLAVAVTGRADVGGGDALAGPAAMGTGALHLEEAVGLANAAGAVAGAAGLGLGALLGA